MNLQIEKAYLQKNHPELYQMGPDTLDIYKAKKEIQNFMDRLNFMMDIKLNPEFKGPDLYIGNNEFTEKMEKYIKQLKSKD